MNWYQLNNDQEFDVLPLSIIAGNNVTEEQLESMLESGQTDVFTQNVSYILLFRFKLAEHCDIDFILTFSFLHTRVVVKLILLSVHELHWNCKGKLVGLQEYQFK